MRDSAGQMLVVGLFGLVMGCFVGGVAATTFPSPALIEKISKAAVARERCAARNGEYRGNACFEKAREIFYP